MNANKTILFSVFFSVSEATALQKNAKWLGDKGLRNVLETEAHIRWRKVETHEEYLDYGLFFTRATSDGFIVRIELAPAFAR